MKSSSSLRCVSLVEQELTKLEQKKQQLAQCVIQAQTHSKAARSIQIQLDRKQSRIRSIDQDIQLAQIRLSKLKNKLKELQSRRANEVARLQHHSIEREQITKAAVETYTPSISTLTQLRLKLIDIETSAVFTSLSQHFTIRKTVVSFLKWHNHGSSSPNLHGLEVYISEHGLVDDLQQFIYKKLQQKKMVQFKLTILAPIRQYLAVLREMQNAIRSQSNISQVQEFNEEKGEQLVSSIRLKEKQEKMSHRIVLELAEKIQRTTIKIRKYEEYYRQIQLEKKELKEEIERDQRKLWILSQRTSTPRAVEIELAEINEAIHYLQSKLNNNENVSSLNSPKSRLVMSKFSKQLQSPILIQ